MLITPKSRANISKIQNLKTDSLSYRPTTALSIHVAYGAGPFLLARGSLDTAAHPALFLEPPPPGPVRRFSGDSLKAWAVTWVPLCSEKVHELWSRWEHHSCGVTPPFFEVMSFEWFNYLLRLHLQHQQRSRNSSTNSGLNSLNRLNSFSLTSQDEEIYIMLKHFFSSQCLIHLVGQNVTFTMKDAEIWVAPTLWTLGQARPSSTHCSHRQRHIFFNFFFHLIVLFS